MGNLRNDKLLEGPRDGDKNQDKHDPKRDERDGQQAASCIPPQVPQRNIAEIPHAAFLPSQPISWLSSRVQMISTSPIMRVSWVEKIKVVLSSCCMVVIKAMIIEAVSRSRLAVGSSASTSLGWVIYGSRGGPFARGLPAAGEELVPRSCSRRWLPTAQAPLNSNR